MFSYERVSALHKVLYRGDEKQEGAKFKAIVEGGACGFQSQMGKKAKKQHAHVSNSHANTPHRKRDQEVGGERRRCLGCPAG